MPLPADMHTRECLLLDDNNLPSSHKYAHAAIHAPPTRHGDVFYAHALSNVRRAHLQASPLGRSSTEACSASFVASTHAHIRWPHIGPGHYSNAISTL